jgi:phosphoribosylformylglycinamidine synthase
MTEKIIHYYRKIETPHSLLPSCKEQLASLGLGEDADKITDVERESCFNVQLSVSGDLESIQKDRLEWLLAETFEKDQMRLEKSFFDDSSSKIWQVEFGPRMTFTSAFSSNACSICRACAIPVERLELSRRYRFHLAQDISEEAIKQLKAMLHDRMTEEIYDKSLTSFDSGASAKPVQTVPIMKEGRAALEKINGEMGLGFDDFDLDYYTTLFKVSAQ